MAESKQTKAPVRKANKKKSRAEAGSAPLDEERKRKLRELDDFIEDVLREAGEEFLDEFKQIEGE